MRRQFSSPEAFYASRISQFAVKQEPSEVFEAVGYPTMYALDDNVASLIAGRLHRMLSQEEKTSFSINKAETYLYQAIRQYIEIIAPEFVAYEDLLKFVDDPRTHQVIAYLSMRPEDNLTQDASSNERSVELGERTLWGKAEDGDYLKLFSKTLRPHPFRRCPYAGLRAPVEQVSPLPLFSRFCRWSGRLAILSYTHHGSVMPDYNILPKENGYNSF